MPTISPVVSLNDGVCNFCSEHQSIKFHGEKEFLKIIESNKDSSTIYDCIVNISGGRDSSYTLLKLVKDYSLKVLAVNYKNPFTDPQAVSNIFNSVRKLNIKLIQFSMENKIHEKILKNNIVAWFKNPSAAMVPAICIGCKIIWPEILKIAKENRVKLIINGGNPYEYTSFKKKLLGVNINSTLEKTYFSNIIGLINESFKNLRYLNPQFLPVTLKGYLFGNQYALGSRILARNIKYIDLFHYLEWDEDTVLSRIKNELDWDYPKEYQTTWRFDCQISHLKDYMYLKTIFLTEKNDFYSKLIREGKISRDDALKRIELENIVQFSTIEQLLNKLNITSIDLRGESKQSKNVA
jgi:hypothetical protein